MKTSVKSLFALALTAIVLSSTAFTGQAATVAPGAVEIAAPLTFNKIVVSGNVTITLVQRAKQEVKSYDGFDETKTSVSQKGYVLYVNSTERERVHLIVYVNDLHRIDASKGAVVKTKGNFDLNVLQVFLKDDAKANVNAKVGSLYTVITDHSDLKLSGATNEHILVKSALCKLDTQAFAALKTSTSSFEEGIAGNNVKPVIVK